ncbi:unnamed protein product [Chrysoparadoxa australica]
MPPAPQPAQVPSPRAHPVAGLDSQGGQGQNQSQSPWPGALAMPPPAAGGAGVAADAWTTQQPQPSGVAQPDIASRVTQVSLPKVAVYDPAQQQQQQQHQLATSHAPGNPPHGSLQSQPQPQPQRPADVGAATLPLPGQVGGTYPTPAHHQGVWQPAPAPAPTVFDPAAARAATVLGTSASAAAAGGKHPGRGRCACASFGFGGRLCTSMPGGYGKAWTVKVWALKDMVRPGELDCDAETFPGPVEPSKRKALDAFIAEKVSGRGGGSEGQVLLWHMVSICLNNSGSSTGKGAPASSGGLEEAVAAALRASHHRDRSGKAAFGGRGTEQPRGNRAGRSSGEGRSGAPSFNTSNEVESCLAEGRREDAVEAAANGGMWGMALVLAMQCDRSKYQAIAKRYADTELGPGSALHALTLALCGSSPQPGGSSASQLGDTWKSTAAALVALRGPKWREQLVQLGDRLRLDLGDWQGAHALYVAGGHSAEKPQKGAKMVLPGVDHRMVQHRSLSTPAAMDGLHMLEALSLVGGQDGEHHSSVVQGHKLRLAMQLADLGHVALAERYLQAIRKETAKLDQQAAGVKSTYTPQFLHALSVFEDRVFMCLGKRPAGGGGLASGAGSWLFKKVSGMVKASSPRQSPSLGPLPAPTEAPARPGPGQRSSSVPSNLKLPQGHAENTGPAPALAHPAGLQTKTKMFTPYRPSGVSSPVPPASPSPIPPASPTQAAAGGAQANGSAAAAVMNVSSPLARARLEILLPEPEHSNSAPPSRKEPLAIPPVKPSASQGNSPTRGASVPADAGLSSDGGKAKKRESSGFLSRFITKWVHPEAKIAHEGEEMQAYYDEDKKMWVFPGEEAAPPPAALAPPPTAMPAAAPSTTVQCKNLCHKLSYMGKVRALPLLPLLLLPGLPACIIAHSTGVLLSAILPNIKA